MYRKTITAAAIIAAGLTAAPAPAQADELVGFDWQLPSGQWLSDEHGVTAGAPELPAGLYRMCFTIPDYATSARYTVTTGANPPRIGDGDWSWTWDDISARIADGTFTKARDFSYSFNAAETTNRDGDPVPGVLNECDIFRGTKPTVIEPGQEHTGGVFAPTPTPTPTESETPTWTPSAEPSETPSEQPAPSAQPSSSTPSASTSEPASPSSSPAPQEASSSPTPEVTPSETPSPAPTASDVPSPSPTAGAPTESTEPQEGPSTPVADPSTSSTPTAAPSETPSSAQSATQKPSQPADSPSPAATTSADRPTHRPALAATGADAAIVWGVVIGFGAILTGVYLTTRKH